MNFSKKELLISRINGKMVIMWAFLFLIHLSLQSQYSISRVEPPSWWTGMKYHEIQLLVYGEGISELRPWMEYPGVQLKEVTLVPNRNYMFITLDIKPEAQPGEIVIQFRNGGIPVITWPYNLLPREEGSARRKGFDNSDVIYLVTPDRFANGDPSNDNMPGYADPANRADREGRHGGDLAGIIQHLDYIEEMGFTALWLNPVLENNMPRTSYHGYAITDYYKVDPRYGTNEQYRELCRQASGKGIKLVMDMVENHCGLEHWWMNDLPSDDWINFGGRFVNTNHRRTTVQDPYVSPSDKALFPDGWFVPDMPDLNQKNPLMARYLIQNSIWWIEYAGLGGIRQDTYSYPDKDFMTDWTCAIMEEYPGFSIVGEEWSLNPAIVSYWQKGKVNHDGYASCLTSLMDFPLQSALIQGLTEGEVMYNEGLIKMYEMLANDFLYADPANLVIFPDNHDMSRFFTQVNEDFDLFRMGIAYILTMRGIPQLYYGTEVLMTNPGSDNHGLIRSDFPGGWEGDKVNAFTGEGLTGMPLQAKYFVKEMLNWRKTKSCIHDGKLMHYNPDKGTYVYFRYDDHETVMVILNKNDHEHLLEGSRFSAAIKNNTRGKDMISKEILSLDRIQIPPRSVRVLELF